MADNGTHSLLTTVQRRYLGDDADPSPQTRRNRRHEIRERLKAGIRDCHLLFGELENEGRLQPRDLDQISALSIGDPHELGGADELRVARSFDQDELTELQKIDKGLIDMVALALTYADHRGIPPEDLLEAGCSRYFQHIPVVDDADISINLDREYADRTDELVTELFDCYPGHGMPQSATQALHENDILSTDEIKSLLEPE